MKIGRSIINAMEGLFKTDPVKNAEVKPSSGL